MPLFTVDSAIREACRAIAERSWMFRNTVSVTTVASTQSYAVTAPTNHEVFAVKAVSIGGATMLTPITDDPAMRHIQSLGTPSFYWFRDGQITLYPTPDAAVTLSIESVIRPTFAATAVDDRFLPMQDAVGYYALFLLMNTNNQVWGNAAAAAFNFQRFTASLNNHRSAFEASGVFNTRHVRPVFF